MYKSLVKPPLKDKKKIKLFLVGKLKFNLLV